MASFDLSTLDVLQISFAIHLLLLLRAFLGKLLDVLLPLLSGCAYKFRFLFRVHESAPSLLSRMLSEQLSLLGLTVLALVALSHTSVSLIPFAHQPHPTPNFLIRVVLSACAARYMVMASWLLLGREMTLERTKGEIKVAFSSAAGESGSRIWDFLYAVICGGTSLISLGYRQNLLLAMTLPFLELSSIPRGYSKLTETMSALKDHRFDFPDTSQIYTSDAARGLNFASLIICIFCRVVLPLLFLALALQQETPLVMDQLPMAWFLLTSAFLSIYHIVLIYREIVKMAGHGKYSKFFRGGQRVFWGIPLFESLEKFCHNNEEKKTTKWTNQEPRYTGHTFCLHDQSEPVTNDIHQNIALKEQNINNCQTDKFGDLNYGLLRPCNNKNLNFCSGELEMGDTKERDESLESCHPNINFAEDKINIARKKDTGKTWLLYKLLANSLASPTSPSTSPISSSLQSNVIDLEPCNHNTSEIQPWMFPALFDAISSTKVQYQTPDVNCEQHSLENSNVIKNEHFQLSSNESYYMESCENIKGSHTSWQGYTEKDTIENSQFNFSASDDSESLCLSSSNKKDLNRPRKLLAADCAEPSTSSTGTLNTDITCSTTTIKSVNQPRYKGKHKLSPDCVQLLGSSKESLPGSSIV